MLLRILLHDQIMTDRLFLYQSIAAPHYSYCYGYDPECFDTMFFGVWQLELLHRCNISTMVYLLTDNRLNYPCYLTSVLNFGKVYFPVKSFQRGKIAYEVLKMRTFSGKLWSMSNGGVFTGKYTFL